MEMLDDDSEEGVGYREVEVREQDRFLPIANIARIMKKTLPNNAKIAKDAKESIQECVSEFISFITSEASDKCQQEKRKTINGDDILWAMSTLGFDRYVEPLKIYLAKYRDSVRGDRPEKKGGEEYGAQPKAISHVGSMAAAGEAPMFSFESTSGVMAMMPDYRPPSMAPGKNEAPLLPPPPPMRLQPQNLDDLSGPSTSISSIPGLPNLQLS